LPSSSPGAQFEFLPIEVIGSGAVLKGVLRFQLKAGLELQTPNVTVLDKDLAFGAGVEMNVFANLAEFVTNITGPSTNNANGCDLEVVQYYEFNLGAAAGATLAFGDRSWGPTPETTVPVFFTTLGKACAKKGTPTSSVVTTATTATTAGSVTTTSSTGSSTTATPSITHAPRTAELAPRDLITTTLLSSVVFMAQSCLSSGLVHCPASLQVTSAFSSVLSLVTAVPSGVIPSFPVTSVASVLSSVAFGPDIKSAIPITGLPTSFTPPISTNDISNFVNGETAGVSNKLILGLGLGLGLPVLIGLITGCV
jgi:hypothetical protein